MKKIMFIIVICLSLFLFIGCNEIKNITIEGENIVNVGKTVKLNVDCDNVIWTSSNESVATVKDGVVTGISEGRAVIEASTKERSGYFFVTVNKEDILKAFFDAFDLDIFYVEGEVKKTINDGMNTYVLNKKTIYEIYEDNGSFVCTLNVKEDNFVPLEADNPKCIKTFTYEKNIIGTLEEVLEFNFGEGLIHKLYKLISLDEENFSTLVYSNNNLKGAVKDEKTNLVIDNLNVKNLVLFISLDSGNLNRFELSYDFNNNHYDVCLTYN